MARAVRLIQVLVFAAVHGCSPSLEDASQVRTHFPEQASHVLGDGLAESFVETAKGFVTARRPGGLQLTLPTDSRDDARFELQGFSVTVRQTGVRQEGRMLGNTVVYPRDDGSSFWTPTATGFEEWLLVQRPPSGETRVATWEVNGARPSPRVDGAVALLDSSGVTRIIVTAPAAFARGAVQVKVALRVSDNRIELHLLEPTMIAEGPILVDPLWQAGPSMSTPRLGHSATLLPNGKVLVVGGINGFSGTPLLLSSAELYDPLSNTWSAAAPMVTARQYHSAILLSNGRVLVAAGLDASGVGLASAELYDPSTNSWSSAGSMSTGRGSFHTATLLSNGRVLVAGGYTVVFQASAELYDPSSNSWSVAAAMPLARSQHTASLLPDGKALVVGGGTANGVSDLAHLYDVVTNTWTSAAAMPGPRAQHVAVARGGKVLVAGGWLTPDYLASALHYDPLTNSWSNAGAMSASRTSHIGTLLPNGTVLVSGGRNLANEHASAETYDPLSNTWSGAGAMSITRSRHTATVLANGMVLITGGVGTTPTSGTMAYASTELFAPSPCTSDADCGMGYCGPIGCAPKQPQGGSCGAPNSCTSGQCVDGLCCDTACAGACDACGLPGRIGICTVNQAGFSGTCGTFVCDGSSASCPIACASNAACTAGSECEAATCVERKADGTSCIAADDCASRNCVDGLCCNTACEGACNGCNLIGSAGTCDLIPAGASATPACATGVCDGVSPDCPSGTGGAGGSIGGAGGGGGGNAGGGGKPGTGCGCSASGTSLFPALALAFWCSRRRPGQPRSRANARARNRVET